MKRLTTDNPQTNMEHMLNYAYAKDGNVVLRFGAEKPNIDLCEYMAMVAGEQCGVKLTPDDFMEGSCLECDNGCPLGVLYVVATQAAELRERLKEYEVRAEELMSLDEAIEHCKEKEDCTACGQEHKQLRKWLEELRARRNHNG